MLALAPPLTHTHSTPALTTTRRPSVLRKQGSFVTTSIPSTSTPSSFPSTAAATASSSTATTAALAPSISRAPSAHHTIHSRPTTSVSVSHQTAPIASTSSYHHLKTKAEQQQQQQQQPEPAQAQVLHHHRAQPSPVTEPPLDIHTYNSQDLLRLLASLLTQIATTNDSLSSHSPLTSRSSFPPVKQGEHPPIWHTLTTASRNSLSTPTTSMAFHARNIPTISLEAYLLRILKYCPATNEVFLSLLVYFDRMSKLVGDATGRTFVIDSYNVHRLVIAGVTVASKFFSDVFYTNSRYAKVGGLPQAELNQLELQFLLLNDFRLTVAPEEMQRYGEQLVRFSQHQTDTPPAATATSPAKPANHLVSSSVPRGVSPAPVPQPRTPPARAITTTTTVASPHAASAYADYAGGPRSMGAIDAYGGSLPSDPDAGHRTPGGRARPPLSAASSYSSAPDVDASDAASEYADTEGGETDDEPTIRAGRSVAGSEAASDAGSVVWRDGDDDDDDGEMSSS